MITHDRLAHIVCEKMSDVALAQNDQDFADLCGGLEKLEEEARQALRDWQDGLPERDCRDLV